MSSSSVWVQLYYKGESKPKGQPIKIKPAPEDVADLIEAVKAKLKPKIDYAPVDEIFIYPPDTEPPFSEDKALKAWDPIPSNSSGPRPLIVVAPAQNETNADPSESTKLRLGQILDLSEFREKDGEGDDGNVRSCWRREQGETRREKLFLRPHLVQVRERVQAFIANEIKTRLYVAGPPGCGKTTYFLLHFTEYAAREKKKGLLVQFRQTEACEIIVIDGRSNEQAVFRVDIGEKTISASYLLGTLNSFVDANPSKDFDFIIFDGVRQATKECQDILGYINSNFYKMNVHITSLEFDIKAGDGSAGSWRSNEYLHMDSWTYDDYEAAYNDKRFRSKEGWLSILGTDKEREENGSSGNQFDGAGDSTDDASNKALEASTGTNESLDEVADSWLKSLLDRKFYYAGGSARLMFDFKLKDLLGGELKDLETKAGPTVWKDLATLSIHAKSGNVSSLLQRLNGKVFPVSKYILYRAYRKCKNELVSQLKTAAEASENPAMKGWAFELEQLEIVVEGMESSNSVTNAKENPTLVLPISKSWAEYDGIKIELKFSSSDVFVIRCSKWNQGCFDLAFYFHKHLLTVNFTISSSHSLKVQYLHLLKNALEGAGKAVDNVTHIAVVPDDEARDIFKFDKPEGNGYSQGKHLYTVEVGCSSKLVPHEARSCNALPDGTSSPNEPVQSGSVQPILNMRKLEEVGVFSVRKGGRKRVKLRDNDFVYS